MNSSNDSAICKTMVIDAAPEVVFRAISDEKELTNWFPDQARLDPRVGGLMEFRFFKDGSEHHRVEGKVLEVVPNRKLSYSWVNTSNPEFPKTVVTWTLEGTEGGSKTRVTLVHTGFDPKSRWHDLHSQGWSYFADRLGIYCRNVSSKGQKSKLAPPKFADRADK